MNIYGPNTDKPEFYVDLAKRLENFAENRIIMGDFNVALDENIDRYSSKRNSKTVQPINKKRSRESIRDLMDQYLLIDVWRCRNIDKTYFSWTKRCPSLIASRIDYTLISQNLSSYVENVTYVPAINTDHSACYMSIDFIQKSRGTGYWKLNCNLLSNPNFVSQINELIQSETDHNDHPLSCWERIKQQVQRIAKKIGRTEKNERQLVISQLLESIKELESNLPLQEKDDIILMKTKRDLNQLVDENTKGIIFRSRANWCEYGVKSSRYFFNLEKSKYNSKTCQLLIDEQGTQHTSDDEILRLAHKHYCTLYKRDNNCKFTLQNVFDVKVPEEEKCKQSGDIQDCEILTAIKGLKNGRTPGYDGLPIEFYKVFGTRLIPLLKKVFICAEAEENMPESSMFGILNLIPKPGKDIRFIKNLRPITLLNTDYKIIEKILANRMQDAMHLIIQ